MKQTTALTKRETLDILDRAKHFTVLSGIEKKKKFIEIWYTDDEVLKRYTLFMGYNDGRIFPFTIKEIKRTDIDNEQTITFICNTRIVTEDMYGTAVHSIVVDTERNVIHSKPLGRDIWVPKYNLGSTFDASYNIQM